jgi:hypothetical protein
VSLCKKKVLNMGGSKGHLCIHMKIICNFVSSSRSICLSVILYWDLDIFYLNLTILLFISTFYRKELLSWWELYCPANNQVSLESPISFSSRGSFKVHQGFFYSSVQNSSRAFVPFSTPIMQRVTI